MGVIKQISRWLAAPLAVVMFMTSFNIGIAHAGLVSTEQLIERGTVAAERDKVREFLAREDVRQEMIDLGVAPDEASARIDSLSDGEVSQIASRIDELPAGEGAVGAVVGALLIVFIILLITDIAGVTDAFDFDD